MNTVSTRQIAVTYGTLPLRDEPKPGFGLFRDEALTNGPTRGLHSLFADLSSVNRGEIIGHDSQRDTQGARLVIDGSMGHGSWELYRLGDDLYVLAGDSMYDTAARAETLPGEGLLEIHLRLEGALLLTLPQVREPINVTGPTMLMLYQPPGMDIPERVLPKSRDTGVSLYCRPQYLAELARRNGIERWATLDTIEQLGAKSVWHRQQPLTPTLLHIANSLLRNPYRGGLRLLHAEATALQLLCEVLNSDTVDSEVDIQTTNSEADTRRLDHVRHLLASQLNGFPRMRDVARAAGMSESKLKRVFKARFGVTVFEYGLECRMRHALELLRCRRMPVGQVSRAVGYQHQTSFTAAFHQFFGFLPNQARKSMH